MFIKRPETTADMEKALLKIIDFSDENHTKGTPSHMAPELVLGLVEMPTRASDVYSTGRIFWEILTLQRPFEKFRSYEIITFHQNKSVLAMPDCPEKIRVLVERCLSYDPLERPNFSQMVDDLERILDEFPAEDEDYDEYVNDCEEDQDEVEDYQGEYEKYHHCEDEDDDDDDQKSTLPKVEDAPIPAFLL